MLSFGILPSVTNNFYLASDAKMLLRAHLVSSSKHRCDLHVKSLCGITDRDIVIMVIIIIIIIIIYFFKVILMFVTNK